MNRITRIAAAAATVCMGAVASAAGVQPIKSEGSAARAVLSTTFLQYDAQQFDRQFAFESRDDIDRALRRLSLFTNYAALAASPGGVTVSCPVSGTLSARVTNALLRTVHLEWNDCVRVFYDQYYTLNGPGDVTLLSATLTPTVVASIRFGDRSRDLVETMWAGRSLPPDYIGDTIYRNFRLTGVLPMTRPEELSQFTGRYTFEVTGFYRYVQHIAEFDAPDGPLYDYDHVVSTDGALLSGEFTSAGFNFNQDFRLLLGAISETVVNPVTPSRPQIIRGFKSVRGTDLRIENGLNYDMSRWEQSIDGRVDVDYSQWWGFNCAAPETWVYRTKSPMAYPTTIYNGIFNTGELNINGNTTVKFSSTGSEPYVDLVGHITTQVGSVGNFNYDYSNFAIFSSPELYTAAICAP